MVASMAGRREDSTAENSAVWMAPMTVVQMATTMAGWTAVWRVKRKVGKRESSMAENSAVWMAVWRVKRKAAWRVKRKAGTLVQA